MSNVSCQKMTAIYQTCFYLLLIIVDFLINIVFIAAYCINYAVKLLLQQLFWENMTEPSNRRKKNSNDHYNQTTSIRGAIDANWLKLLSSSLTMNKKTEQKVQENKKEHFTGTFRRGRKKKGQDDISSAASCAVQTLNLTSEEGNKLAPRNNEIRNKLTKFLAMDCEMVGVGFDGNDHMLARVSIVNKFGDCVYDKFVKAREEVKDYRTSISGVRKEDLLNGEDFTTVQKEVSEMLRGRILVGHSLKNDMSVLFLSHPKRNIRDTSRYKPFRNITKGSTPSLKRLAKEILGIDIQHGEHSSVEDAKAVMQLYCTVAEKWEASVSDKRGNTRIVDD